MHLLFDLDGTLTDSSPGIIRCINFALTELGQAALPDAQLRGMIGRPLALIFERLLDTPDDATVDRAIDAFRVRFNDVGIFENSVFPGIAEALTHLRQSGHRLQVVTAKPLVNARRVVEHFGLLPLFDAVHGPALDHRACDKAELVADALRTAGDDRTAVMIGDHADDIRAARRHGLRAAAVAWGYGTPDEIASAQPDYIAATTTDLVRWIETLQPQPRETTPPRA